MGKYTVIPKQILVEHYIRKSEEAKMLSIYEKMTIQMLASIMGKGDSCWTKQKELAQLCSISERKLQRTLQQLQDKNIINIERKKYTNIYSFNEFWAKESEKFASHCLAAESFSNNQDTNNGRADTNNGHPNTSNGRISYINNINNNKKNNNVLVKDFKKPVPAETAQQPSSLLSEWQSRKSH